MTDAAWNQTNRNSAVSGQRISTHPAYTEYSWETLAGKANTPRTAPPRPRGNQNQGNVSRSQKVGAAPRSRSSGAPTKQAASAAAKRREQVLRQTQHTAVRSGTRSYPNAEQARKKAQANRAKTAAALRVQAEKAEKIRRKSIVAIHTIVVEKKYSFPLAVVLIALGFTILIMAIVTTSVQINEITTENSSLQRQYSSLLSEENELRLQLETRDDLRTVETMAKNELGMVKKDEVERYYLTVHKEDKIEIVEETVEEKPNVIDKLLSFGGAIVERVKSFFGM